MSYQPFFLWTGSMAGQPVTLTKDVLPTLDYSKINGIYLTLGGFRFDLWRFGARLKSGKYRALLRMSVPSAKSNSIITLTTLKGSLPEIIKAAETVLLEKFLPKPSEYE